MPSTQASHKSVRRFPRRRLCPGPGRIATVDSAAAQHARWAARFGRVVAAGGVAAIPQALFYYQGALGLQAQEVWFVCCILADRWDGALPHTSLAQLAQRSLLSGSQVRRIKLGLEQQGALRTLPRHDAASASQLANDYDFAGLFGRLERLVAADPPPANAIRDADAPAVAAAAPALAGDGSFVARYGRLLVGYGVAAIPRALFLYQRALALKPQHVWFCCYILAHKWTTELPYPSLRKMEERTGYGRRQLQVIKEELIAAGRLEVAPRRDPGNRQISDGYDFSPLLDALARLLDRDHAASGRAPGLLRPVGAAIRRRAAGDAAPHPRRARTAAPAPRRGVPRLWPPTQTVRPPPARTARPPPAQTVRPAPTQTARPPPRIGFAGPWASRAPGVRAGFALPLRAGFALPLRAGCAQIRNRRIRSRRSRGFEIGRTSGKSRTTNPQRCATRPGLPP